MATKKATSAKKATKVVRVVARIEFKADTRKVVYQVRSSNGKDIYFTSMFAGHATSCTCPATKPCYHMTQLEAIEAARTPNVQPTQAADLGGYSVVEQAATIAVAAEVAAEIGDAYEVLAPTKQTSKAHSCWYCGRLVSREGGVCASCK